MYLSSVIVQGTSITHLSQFDWDGKEKSEKDKKQMHFCFLCAVDKQNRNWIPELLFLYAFEEKISDLSEDFI